MSTSISLASLLRAETGGFIHLSSEQLAALEQHYELLLRWNKKMNLTTVTELPMAATRHYGESLFLASRLKEGRVVDIGSGAGFPGIPLAIARPNCTVDLVEAHQRKAVFLREACRGLPNVRVFSVRAQELECSPQASTRDVNSSRYDWLVSRAVNARELVALRMAARYALLLGKADLESLPNPDVYHLPWGDERVLATGAFRTAPDIQCST